MGAAIIGFIFGAIFGTVTGVILAIFLFMGDHPDDFDDKEKK